MTKAIACKTLVSAHRETARPAPNGAVGYERESQAGTIPHVAKQPRPPDVSCVSDGVAESGPVGTTGSDSAEPSAIADPCEGEFASRRGVKPWCGRRADRSSFNAWPRRTHAVPPVARRYTRRCLGATTASAVAARDERGRSSRKSPDARYAAIRIRAAVWRGWPEPRTSSVLTHGEASWLRCCGWPSARGYGAVTGPRLSVHHE